jgi:hypothetical protein
MNPALVPILLAIAILGSAVLFQLWSGKKRKPEEIKSLQEKFDELHKEEAPLIEVKPFDPVTYELGLVVRDGMERIKLLEKTAGSKMGADYTTNFPVPGDGHWKLRLERHPGNAPQQR